jgi:endonuclease/exonuclease/phosphatase family metal-dependent hydrolase
MDTSEQDKDGLLGRTGHGLAQIVAYLVAGYGLVSFVFWVLQWFIGEGIPFIGMIKSGVHLLLLPALLLLPRSLLLRKWRLSLFLAPTCIAFLLSYGIFFLPRGHKEMAGAQEVRVMTFNIQAPAEEAVSSLVEILREGNADIIALQELSTAAAQQLSTALGEEYPHQALHPQDPGHAGQGIFSRYPIVADDYWRYEQNPTALGHQRVEIDLEGRDVIFYNTHPIPPYAPGVGFNAEQHTQALRDVLARARSERAPTVLLGDFNMTDHFHEYRRIQDDFTDAYKAVGEIGFGFTYPHDKWTAIPPLIRLDYIFYGPAWLGISAEVWPGSGTSDHAPLLARLALP